MRKLLPVFVLAAACEPSDCTPRLRQPAVETCVVTSITDGDTLRCGERRIRLLGIDTPERSQRPFGDSATAALHRFAPPGFAISLEHDIEREDRYGRELAYVYNHEGTFVNEAMVADGYAIVLTYEPNVRHEAKLTAVQAEAHFAAIGLWPLGGFSCTPRQHRKEEC